MAFGKALGLAGTQSVVRIILGFVSAKVSAIYLGPAGTALLGQINSLLQVVQGTVANGAEAAVVNLTAERRGEARAYSQLWTVALRLVLTLACVAAGLMAVFSVPIANWLLGAPGYWPVIIVAGLAAILGVLDKVILGTLNGLKLMGSVARANIVSSVLEVAAFTVLVYLYGLWGGLLGVAAIYTAKLVVSSTFAFRSGFLPLGALREGFDRATLKAILGFYPMLLVQSAAPAIADILVRNSVMAGLGLEQAGYLQATWRLSNIYLGVLTTAAGLFFMAHYAELTDDRSRGVMMRRVALQMFGLTVAAAAGIYLLREWIILIVLTGKFLPMGDLMPLQLLGDVFKMTYLPLAMALVVARRSSAYMFQAAAGAILFVALTYLLQPWLGVQGAPAAYASYHFATLLYLVVAQRRYLFRRRYTINLVEGQR